MIFDLILRVEIKKLWKRSDRILLAKIYIQNQKLSDISKLKFNLCNNFEKLANTAKTSNFILWISYRVYQRFRLTKQDDYFRVSFDHC